MKTENIPTVDPVWTHNVELSIPEECLPIIGSSQVSSILQNLDPITTANTANHEVNPQNLDLIIIPTSDLNKIPCIENPLNLQSNYVILKENSSTKSVKPKLLSCNDNSKQKEGFEDMLYFVCNLCPFLCTKDSKITEHLENAHKNKTVIKLPELKCPACQNIFYHKMSLRSHLIHDHGVGNSDLSQIIQAVIYYSNKTKSKMKEAKHKIHEKLQNVEKHTEINDFSTDTKSMGANNYAGQHQADYSNGLPNKHEPITIPLPQIEIPLSSSVKINNSTMKQNITKHLDSNEIKCGLPNCKVKLQDLEKMNYHINSHSGDGFKCLDCGETFLFWKPLTSHLWRYHNINMELFSCDKCEYKTYSLAKLNNIHKFIHSDDKSFLCDICNKAFKNNKQMRNHKLTHKDKAIHSCEECSKTFGDKRQLRSHMDVVHKKLRPFLCNFCGYKGSSRSSLKMHVRQHTGEKPFSCSACSYTTSDHNSLRRHKLRHTGHKPYKCSYCSYACIQTSTYKMHLKTKHPGMEKDLMFTCHHCQFRSVSREIYSVHMATVHKVKLKDD
ncbi:unnamed protein product [Phaedon cochleariae]|uniref:C2H2-type domain-containing protein n=1 Tax=Phaedon cochleariae TaxID=80249 RepID=A0A9P0DE08_PHACE|nr:unnamed protein product [Phaedon cochleariae]